MFMEALEFVISVTIDAAIHGLWVRSWSVMVTNLENIRNDLEIQVLNEGI